MGDACERPPLGQFFAKIFIQISRLQESECLSALWAEVLLATRINASRLLVWCVGVIGINSNLSALRAQRSLAQSEQDTARVLERLGSGLRINRASDDAAGLAISSSLNADSRIFGQAIRNVNDGISLLNIADSAVGQMSTIVTRLTELATQAANGSYSRTQRSALATEADQLVNEFNRLVQSSSFNGRALFDAGLSDLSLQLGRGSSAQLTTAVGSKLKRNRGTGDFSLGPLISDASSFDEGQAADIDNDGDMDFIALSEADQKIRTYRNDGSGNLSLIDEMETNGNVSTFAVGDINNDGFVDIITNNNSTVGKGELVLGVGDKFVRDSDFDTGGSDFLNSVAIADLDGDGWAEVITGDMAGNLRATSGVKGGPAITNTNLGTWGGGPVNEGQIKITDFNNDGKLDIVVGIDRTLSILTAVNSSSFTRTQSITATNPIQDFAIGDLNRDGLNDIMYTSDVTAELRFGVSATSVEVAPSVDYWSSYGSVDRVSFTDQNGDGILDLVFGYRGELSLFLLNADGSVRSRTQSLASSSSGLSSISIADFTGDGVLDVIAGDDVGFSLRTATAEESNEIGLINLHTAEQAREALNTLAELRSRISSEQGALGAHQSRLQAAVSVLRASKENFESASSRISDADVANESAALVRYQILQQAGAAVLTQAIRQPQLALQLLR